MGRPRKSEAPWYQPVAEVVVREGLSMLEAATKLGLPKTSGELAQVYRTKEFQRILRQERYRYQRELAQDPERSKTQAIGMLLLALEKMFDQGEYEKVVEGILKLGKIEGWVGADSTVTVFAGLTAKDLEEVKTRLRAKMEEAGVLPN